MKLISVTLHNYLSHPDTTFELNGTRLAAIVGPNGAGKSALLEALKYVLFDDGRAKTDQLVRLGETDMSAAIEFDFSGCRYRAVRGRTSKGAGKSYLELAVQAVDGSWTSLSGDDIRDTQGKILTLLGVDAATFGTAVFLGQGEANRFAEATAGERKRILGQVLGLEIYAKAEARARDDARTLEAATAMDRSTLERLDDAIAELAGAPALVEERKGEISEVEAAVAVDRARRGEMTARLTTLAGEIAKGDAAAAEIARLEEQRSALADRYRRERAAITASDKAIAAADTTLADAGKVEHAAELLTEARAEVDRLVAGEAADRAAAEQLATRQRAFAEAMKPHEAAGTTWETELRTARQRVTDLAVAANALEPVVCEKCSHPNVVDQADVRGQARAARARVKELEAAQPKEPMALSRERVAIKRDEERRAEAPWDPAPLAAAREQLAEIAADAARVGEISAARRARETAVAAQASAEAELVSIGTDGKAIAARIETAKAATVATAALLEEQATLTTEAKDLDDAMDVDARRLRDLAGLLAGAEANVTRLQQLQEERDGVAGRLAEADVALAELRRLVGAFGVTGIPARIIEGVLPELSGYANELLGELRPGMVLEIRAQRAKRDGKGVVEALDLIVRDEVGERPLAVFSGGERMSVSLAIATALSRLVARRAGTAIRTLVIDEPDGLDLDARRSFGQALRVLAHHGELERVVLVSHHPDLAEFGDAVYQVTKNGAGSTVELVA